jgi:hypothetical protein
LDYHFGDPARPRPSASAVAANGEVEAGASRRIHEECRRRRGVLAIEREPQRAGPVVLAP